MTPEQFLEQLRNRFGTALSEAEVKGPVLLLTTTADQGYAVCQALHDLGFEYLNCLSGVDWTTHLEVVYDLSSLHHATKAHLRVKVDRTDPLVRSVSVLWKAANWHERECYDMFGVQFDGHPDHRRILLSEDWVGFPLRKDYTDERLVPYTDYGLEEKQAKTEAGKGAPKPAPVAPKPPAPPKPPASAG